VFNPFYVLIVYCNPGLRFATADFVLDFVLQTRTSFCYNPFLPSWDAEGKKKQLFLFFYPAEYPPKAETEANAAAEKDGTASQFQEI